MKYLNKEAAKVVFKEKNKVRSHHLPRSYVILSFFCGGQGQPEGTIDLHGLHVEEALDCAKRELQLATGRVNNTVRFIVGAPF